MLNVMSFNVNVENRSHNVANCSRYYNVRVYQSDGHMAWSSPIWVVLEMNEGE